MTIVGDFLGSKQGTCPVCRETGTLLMLRDGVMICEDCLDACIQILKLAENGISRRDLASRFSAGKRSLFRSLLLLMLFV